MTDYLYHGSPVANIEVFEPRPARGMGPDKDKLVAVYATHSKEFAIPFALPLEADDVGHLGWFLEFPDELDHPVVALKAGVVNFARKGYLYRLPSESFEQIDELQWVSYAPVTPLDVSVIDPNDYAHWIRKEGNKCQLM